MARELNIPLRTLSGWKKDKMKLYNRLAWSFKAEELLKAIDINNDDMQAKIKELLQDS